MANDRVYQVPVEAVVLPDTQAARVSQVAAEAVILPDTQSARLSQIVVEVVYPSSNPVTPATEPGWSYVIG